MLFYFSTDRYSQDDISFHPINISKHVSLGQRCEVDIDGYVTVGVETLLPHDYSVSEGGTIFGSPPLSFTSTANFKDIITQTQLASQAVIDVPKSGRSDLPGGSPSADMLSLIKLKSSDDKIEDEYARPAIQGEDKTILTESAKVNSASSRIQDIGSGK